MSVAVTEMSLLHVKAHDREILFRFLWLCHLLALTSLSNECLFLSNVHMIISDVLCHTDPWLYAC